MKFGQRQRWMVLIALLTLALTAAAWVRDSDRADVADVVEAPVPGARPQRAAPLVRASVERVELEKLRGQGVDANPADPFAARSWRRPPPVPAANAGAAPEPAPPPPPPPTAPPLPFAYLGKLVSEEANAVFLTLGERNLVVHEGDVIDSTYRIDKLADTRVTLTHLPTGIQQTLEMGEVQ